MRRKLLLRTLGPFNVNVYNNAFIRVNPSQGDSNNFSLLDLSPSLGIIQFTVFMVPKHRRLPPKTNLKLPFVVQTDILNRTFKVHVTKALTITFND